MSIVRLGDAWLEGRTAIVLVVVVIVVIVIIIMIEFHPKT